MDMMAIRRALMSGDVLPPMYKPVDYVVSTGQGAFIDTGVSGDDDTLEFECDFYITEQFNYAGIFGNYTGSGQKAWRLIQGTVVTWLYTNNHASSGIVLYIPDDNFVGSRLTVIVNASESTSKKDDRTKSATVTTKDGTETGYNIAIGKHAVTGKTSTVTATYQTRFYGFKISRGGVLIRDYIPCLRTKDNIAGFWDKVNKRFQSSDSIYEFGYGYDT